VQIEKEREGDSKRKKIRREIVFRREGRKVYTDEEKGKCN
jgi:hypothetical protein